MNSVAAGQYVTGVIIVVFNLMNNHAHFLVWGTGNACVDFFLFLKRRFNSTLSKDGHISLDDDYGMVIVPVENQLQLRDVIVYICRNPYKARLDLTPSGYIWGTNYLLFNDVGKMITKIRLDTLSVTGQRKLLGTKVLLPGGYLLNKETGMILPESYTRHDKAVKVLDSSHVYLSRILRDTDAYIKIAEGIGETVRIDDNELDYIIWTLVRNKFNAKSISELGTDDRCRLAVALRKKYYIEPKRICRKVGLPMATLEELLK